MQPSVLLSGILAGSGKAPDGGYPTLTITSTPPCALPVAQNCSSKHFDPSAHQWEAYSGGDFLTGYIAHHKIASLQGLFSQAITDFLPNTVAEGLVCNPDAEVYDCPPPAALDNCVRSSFPYHSPGLCRLEGVKAISTVSHYVH